MRKLASIQKIAALFPIQGADLIEEAQVLGWRTVVKKGEFQVDDLCVFFEVDSILPETEWSKAFRSRRLKTMKLRGVLSQGVALPVKTVFPNMPDWYEAEDIEGVDVTELVGVVKYDNEVHVGANGVKGVNPNKEADFPSRVPKTDEERVQSAPRDLAALQGKPYVITTKYDGSSFTAVYEGFAFRVCSRNMAVKLNEEAPDNYWKMALKYNLREVLKDGTYAVQGELCGPGIQKNRLNLKELDLFIFNVYDWKAGKPLDHNEMVAFCVKHGLKHVAVDEIGSEFNYTQESLLEKAKGLYTGTKNRREGIVIRSLDSDNRISFKAINNDFLLKDEE